MNTNDSLTVHDVHYAPESPLADALGKLQWPAQIIWFHNFGLTHVGDKRHLLRIGLVDQRSGGQVTYLALQVSLFAPGGSEIAHQDFPFNNYDNGKVTAAKQITLSLVKEKYAFVIGASASGTSPRDATDSDLRRLDTLCTAVFRWATLMSGGVLPETKRHLRPARTTDEQSDTGGVSATAPRKSMSTDPDHIVVLDDESAHDQVRV